MLLFLSFLWQLRPDFNSITLDSSDQIPLMMKIRSKSPSNRKVFEFADKLQDLTNKNDPGDILSIRGQVLVCGFILRVEEKETVTFTQRWGVKRIIERLLHYSASVLLQVQVLILLFQVSLINQPEELW